MTAGRIVAAIFGVLLAPIAFGLLVGGIALVVLNATARDDDGFFRSPAYVMSSDGRALISTEIDLAPYPGDWWPTGLVDVRFSIESTNGVPLFFGIGSTDDVAGYLTNVARSRVIRLGDRPTEVTYRNLSGDTSPAAPAQQDFWEFSATSSDSQTLTWDARSGEWTIVIMNADGSAGVDAVATFAARVPILYGIGIGMAIAGVLFGGLSALLLVVAFGGLSGQPATRADEPFSVPGSTVYPALIEGTIDEPLSRWMWLVKWFLAIPHFIVIGFLWIAFWLLTIIAFFAILFTGRYPRSIFEFNVGVMRWSWRVIFYATSVIATDRYPPFTLADADYPARLDVAYPERLSQGLVLVKWWLLAIPHYIIIGLFTNGLIWWTTDVGEADRVLEIGGGLIGILSFIAVLVLLFTGRYPRSLFDLLMGLVRWLFRVGAYATLMRDEYPPFRLDLGGREPAAMGEQALTGSSDQSGPAT